MTTRPDSTHTIVSELRDRFTHLEDGVQQLHRDHRELRDRVTVVEGRVVDDIANLSKHEAEACLREDAIIARLDHMREADQRNADLLEKHTKREDEDRRIFMILIGGALLSSTGTLLYLILTRGLA